MKGENLISFSLKKLIIISVCSFVLFCRKGSCDDGPRGVKKDNEEGTFTSFSRAKESMEYEDYLQQKQNEQEALRNTSKTHNLLMNLRGEGNVQKLKSKEEETQQQKFLKDKLKNPPESQKEKQKEKSGKEEKKEESLIEVKKANPLTIPALKSLEDDAKKKEHFYKIRLLFDVRNAEQNPLKKEKLLMASDYYRFGSEIRPKETQRDILNDVSFLREIDLFQYTEGGEL